MQRQTQIIVVIYSVGIKPGGNHRNFNLPFFQAFILHRPKNNLGLAVNGLGDDFGGILDLEHSEVFAACNREEDAFGAGNRNIEKRRVDGGLG